VVTDRRVVFEGEALALDEVARCAHRLGRALRPGELVYLEGPLGAGKTTFVRALCEVIEVVDPVRSPSFTLANIYRGSVTVQHLDLYRLEELGEEDALALEEYVDGEALTLVEWPQAGKGRLGEASWSVLMDHQSVDTRRLKIIANTADGATRWRKARRDG